MEIFKTQNHDLVLSLISNNGYKLVDAFGNSLIVDVNTPTKYFIDTDKKNIVKPNAQCESLYGALGSIQEISELNQINP